MINIEPAQTSYDLRFRLFGVPVRVHPFFWLMSVMFGINPQGSNDPKMVLLWVLVVFVSILVHEFGHIFAMRYFGERGHVVLHGFGGLAISSGGARRTYRNQVIISLAGPFAGFLLAAVLALVLLATRHVVEPKYLPPFGVYMMFSDLGSRELNNVVWDLFQVNIYWGLLNLLPIFPLDGGQVCNAVLSAWRPHVSMIRALEISIATAAAVAILALLQKGDAYLTLMFGYLAYQNYLTLNAMLAAGTDAMAVTLDEPRRRVILLGASNVARGLATVIRTSQSLFNEPIDFVAAIGHGRSYGMRSAILGRSLPGILQSGMWTAIQQRSALPTVALVTDVGNDILFHAPVQMVVEWVDRCLTRLTELGAKIVVTGLPVCNLAALSPARFLFFRSLFVPSCRLALGDTISRASELHERLRELAVRHDATWIEQRAEWFGIDPIHVRMRCWPAAWREILGPLAGDAAKSNGAATSSSTALWWRLRWVVPEERKLLGWTQGGRQPCLALEDGSRLSLY